MPDSNDNTVDKSQQALLRTALDASIPLDDRVEAVRSMRDPAVINQAALSLDQELLYHFLVQPNYPGASTIKIAIGRIVDPSILHKVLAVRGSLPHADLRRVLWKITDSDELASIAVDPVLSGAIQYAATGQIPDNDIDALSEVAMESVTPSVGALSMSKLIGKRPEDPRVQDALRDIYIGSNGELLKSVSAGIADHIKDESILEDLFNNNEDNGSNSIREAVAHNAAFHNGSLLAEYLSSRDSVYNGYFAVPAIIESGLKLLERISSEEDLLKVAKHRNALAVHATAKINNTEYLRSIILSSTSGEVNKKAADKIKDENILWSILMKRKLTPASNYIIENYIRSPAKIRAVAIDMAESFDPYSRISAVKSGKLSADDLMWVAINDEAYDVKCAAIGILKPGAALLVMERLIDANELSQSLYIALANATSKNKKSMQQATILISKIKNGYLRGKAYEVFKKAYKRVSAAKSVSKIVPSELNARRVISILETLSKVGKDRLSMHEVKKLFGSQPTDILETIKSATVEGGKYVDIPKLKAGDQKAGASPGGQVETD